MFFLLEGLTLLALGIPNEGGVLMRPLASVTVFTLKRHLQA